MQDASSFAGVLCQKFSSDPNKSYGLLAGACAMVDPNFTTTGEVDASLVGSDHAEIGRRGGLASVATHGEQMREGRICSVATHGEDMRNCGLASVATHGDQMREGGRATSLCRVDANEASHRCNGCGLSIIPTNTTHSANYRHKTRSGNRGRFIRIECGTYPCNHTEKRP